MSHKRSSFRKEILLSVKASSIRACLSLHKIKTKPLLLVFTLALGFFSTLPLQQVNAVTKTSTLSSTDMAKSFAAYRWLRSCMDRGNFSGTNAPGAINKENVNNYKWFSGSFIGLNSNISTAGVINDPDDGDISCGDDEGANFIKSSLGLWGYSNGADFLCDIGFKRDAGSACTNISDSGTNNFNKPDALAAKLDTWWKDQLGNSSTTLSSIANGGEYALYLQSFLAKCGTPSSSGEYTIQIFNPGDPKPIATKYTAISREFTQTSGDVRIYQESTMKCGEIANKINSETDAAVLGYIKFLAANGNIDEGNQTDLGGVTTERQSSCVIEGIGWIVCPITNFLALIADSSFDVISGFLEVNVSLYDSNSGTKVAWDAFRNIANVAFVVAFLVIIFSQLTGQGVSNYGVKKTLPRIIVAAILVNISFYICQIAVDVTQILGGSIRDVLSAIPVGDPTNTVVPEWSTVMGDVLMGSGILVGALAATAALSAIVALSISLPVLLAALLAILMTVIILIGRQAAIVILITLAPLAFVAFLLPNTEAWFKRWYKMFFALLMVFPIIALLYGGGELAAKIIANTANSPGVEASAKFWLSITAMGVAAIPLIMTPTLLKGALNGLGSIGGKISGFASKANANIRKTANTSSRYGEAKAGLKNRFALGRANRRVHSNTQQSIDNSRLGRAFGLDKGSARAIKAIDAEEGAEVEAAVAQIQHATTSTNRVDQSARILKDAIITGDVTKARAAQKILLNSGNVGLSTLQGVYSGTHKGTNDDGSPDLASEELSKKALGALNSSAATGYLRSELNSAGLKGKNNALARFGFEKLKNPSDFESLVNSSDTYSKLNSVELAGQSESNLDKNQSAISQTAAQAVLDNSAAAALLDDKKRAIFTARAKNTIYTPPSSNGEPIQPPQPPTIQQAPVLGDGGLQIAHGAQDVHRAVRDITNQNQSNLPPTPPPDKQPPRP